MSPGTSKIADLLEGFSALPVVTATKEIMKDMTSLLSMENLMDEHLKTTHRELLERFVQAMEHMYTVLEYLDRGLMYLSIVLDYLQRYSPGALLNGLLEVDKLLLCGQANATDAVLEHESVKKDIEDQLIRAVGIHGPDTIIEIASTSFIDIGIVNIEKTTLQCLQSTITLHLEQIKIEAAALAGLLQELTKFFQSFLEDETVSLERPFLSTPPWSTIPTTGWEVLREHVGFVESKLKAIMLANKPWFKWSTNDEHQLLDADRSARIPQLILLSIRIPIPAEPEKSETRECLEAPQYLVGMRLKSSGMGTICIESVDRSQTSITTLKFVFHTESTNSWAWTMHNLVVGCKLIPDEGPPVSFAKYHPNSVKDLVEDSHFQPKDCKPILKITERSNTEMKWTFVCPVFRLKPNPWFPTDFSIVFEVEHSVGVEIEITVSFAFHHFFIWKVIQHLVASPAQGMYLPPASTSTEVMEK